MKQYKGLKLLPIALLGAMAFQAMSIAGGLPPFPVSTSSGDGDTITELVNINAPDPEYINWDSIHKWTPKADPIIVLTRTYGDSVVLRWAIAQYPNFLYLSRTGVDILRMDNETARLDTLILGLKPLSLDEFRKQYPDTTDQLAYLAIGSLYGKGGLREDQAGYMPGSLGNQVEIEQDQKMRLLGAYLPAEWRADLAKAMGLRYTDRTAKKGRTYTYFIAPSKPDTTKFFYISPGSAEFVKNERYKPQQYDVDLRAEVTGHGTATLRWNDNVNGSFEIYRRRKGEEKEWTKLNAAPYLPPLKMEYSNEDIVFENSTGRTGTYEYAVQAHDAFGDLTEMSQLCTVYFPDMMPPSGPDITRIVIDRPVEGDPSAEIFANVYFHKDTIENDFVRYAALYYHERDSLKEWRLLSDQYIAPEDTLARIEVTHISTGMMTIAAIDTAGNMGYALPRLLRVSDLKPPVAPSGFKATSYIDGRIHLRWEMPDSVDIKGYEIFFANDTTHSFVRVNSDLLNRRYYTDSVATDANQRYIYYMVRAVDFAGNRGDASDTIRVLRPYAFPPAVAHLDSTRTTGHHVYMRWGVGGDVQMGAHRLLRKMESEPDDRWTVLAVYDADSIASAGHRIEYTDRPAPNRSDRYEYAVESFSLWGLSSGLSHSLLARVRGDNYVDIGLKAFATYDGRTGMARVVWEHSPLSDGDPYYYCIYRKADGGTAFRYVIDVSSSERLFTDRLLPGETSEYYITIRFKDGRGTLPSNIVSITAPKRKDHETNP